MGEASDPAGRLGIALRRLYPKASMLPSVRAGQTPVAMPMHASLDAHIFAVDADSAELFAKVYDRDLAFAPEIEHAAEASKRAGFLGIAPPLRASFTDLGVQIFDMAPHEFHMAMRPDFDRQSVRANTLGALRAWHQSEALSWDNNPFDVLRTYRTAAELLAHEGPLGSTLPLDWDAQRRATEKIEIAINAAGVDKCPIHGECLISNVMINDRDHVLLVDFDRAGNSDPIYDLAALCLEFCTSERDLEEAVEAYWGHTDTRIMARARLYMIIEDLIWGLWARLAHFCSARSGYIEFYKYGEVRLIRARSQLESYDIHALARSL
jgi:Phosphotransferase enzyme family